MVLHGDNTDDRGAKLTNCFDCITRHRIAIVRGSQASLAMPAPDEDAGF